MGKLEIYWAVFWLFSKVIWVEAFELGWWEMIIIYQCFSIVIFIVIDRK